MGKGRGREDRRRSGGRGAGRRDARARTGRVVATKGRRVVVRDAEGDRVCFLSGQRAVVGDRVHWVPARGEGGKLVEVAPRERVLARSDFNGREQLVAAHLGGLLVVTAAATPPHRPGLVDRYLVGASFAGLDAAVVLTKIDLGVSEEVAEDLAWRRGLGTPVLEVSMETGEGGDAVRAFLADHADVGPWAFVGHSGVGKTSLTAALLPGEDVGPIGEISEFWDQGRHTTTGSRIFELGDGAEIVDSPGIRTFLPGGLTPHTVRDHFPGLGPLGCRYRDCLHRAGEDGCVAEDPEVVDPAVLVRYRRLLAEVLDIEARTRPGA